VATESPKYKVTRKEGKIEIREYDAVIVAEVELDSTYDSALSGGFNELAGYIFGNNLKRARVPMTSPVTEQEIRGPEKIPMTTPVTTEGKGGKYRVAFSMPSKYKLDNLPEPNNPAISFREIGPRKMAAIRFSGYLTEKVFKKKSGELGNWLGANALVPRGSYISAQYNPPWIPWFARRNEVLVEV
jgi:hypothetical protein